MAIEKSLRNPKDSGGLRLVGATGFEPATTCTPSKCATRLRYAPKTAGFRRGALCTPDFRPSNSIFGIVVVRLRRDVTGVFVNPDKSTVFSVEAADRVIVLAEE